jgi:FkbH-like protein
MPSAVLSNCVPRSNPPVVIGATFTAEPIGRVLGFWLKELGLDCGIEFSAFNQVFQQVVDPASAMARNREGVNVVLLRWEDWAAAGALETTVRSFAEALRGAVARWKAPAIVVECPSKLTLGALLEEELAGVEVIRAAEVARLYPVAETFDATAEKLGRVPYTAEAFAALATVVARRIDVVKRPPYKVIAVDADNTLWRGVCAEDGPRGIVVDAGYRCVQELLAAQREAGMLLVLVSKNEEADIAAAFAANPEMPLGLEHFLARRVNWEAKSANLRSLAEELSLGLDAFVFLDDNPAEVAEVRAHAPAVLALRLDTDAPARFVEHVWALDHARLTKEDRERGTMYAQNLERARVEKQSGSLEHFLAELQLELRIEPVCKEKLARAAQLTQRTNQMNFSGVRRAEGELKAAMDAGLECLTADLTDRFGSYGTVGVMAFEANGDALVVDTFLLSCRALGKGVEHRLLARLGEVAVERGLAWVEARFVPTARNRPARKFLDSIAFGEPREDGYRFAARELSALRFVPAGAVETAEEAPAAKPAAARRAVDYQAIADGLWSVESILARATAAPAGEAVADGPRTAREREIAELWRELLAVPAVGVHENFFDAGGHSLLAVQLLSRVRQRYGVELSPELVYDGAFTVESLARAIELAEIEGVGAAQYAGLLEEIESLTDEEVRTLLAQEEREG